MLGADVSEGSAAVLSVRPEDVHVAREQSSGPCLTGKVLEAIFLGNCTDCRVMWGTFEWKVLAHPRTRLKPGERVFLQFDPERCLAVKP
jgi:ABC-type Fe3+/spermidine/putrescine transport system ATPase subunit